MESPFLINHNYGDNYVVEAGATVIAGGIGAALRREQEADDLCREAQEQGVTPEALRFAYQQWQQKPQDERMKFAILQMKEDKCPLCPNPFFSSKQTYQYAYLCYLMIYDSASHPDLPHFNKVSEFRTFLMEYLEIPDVPTVETLNNTLKPLSGKFPHWKIEGGSINDEKVALSVAQRFISLYRKGSFFKGKKVKE